MFIQIFTILFSHCPQIAKASLGGQCLLNMIWIIYDYNRSFSTLKTFQGRHNKTILFGQEKDLTKVSTLILREPVHCDRGE